MVRVWASRGYDINKDENLVSRYKYTVEAIERFGLEAIAGSEQEVGLEALDGEGRYAGR